MDDAKPIASLSPGLLARKGGARPAMRSQYQTPSWTDATESEAIQALANPVDDDLGWNDLGHDLAENLSGPAEAKVLRLPQVIRQREALKAAMAVEPVQAVERRSAFDQGRRAAFTLRVDAERHLRLRMACAVQNRSAQQLVTEALDRVLAEVEGLEDLARRARRH